MWGDFVYQVNPEHPALIPLKLTTYGTISNPAFSCTGPTISGDLSIHIPDVLFPDQTTHFWMDLE